MTTNQKQIETLVEDIYQLLDENTSHEVNEDFLEAAAEQFKEALRRKLSKQERKGSIRMSGLGKPDCQVRYKVNEPHLGEGMPPKAHMKFLYGDILEVILLYLAKEAGHTVEHEQLEVECDGVKGHLDAVIDGVVVDAKSASSYSFKKFEDGTLSQDDPFGYISQVAAYCHTTGIARGGFLVIDKTLGDLCFMELSREDIDANHPQVAIDRQRKVVSGDISPSRFDPTPDGKSGNMKLATMCSYCDFKYDCWKDSNGGRGLRTFIYSNGPRFLTAVAREPDVYES